MPGLPGHQGPHLPQGALGEEHKDHRGDEHLVEQGDVEPVLPRPQHRQGVGQHVGHRGGQPPLPVEHPGHHPRQGVGHGVEGQAPGGEIHPQPGGHPHRGPHADAPGVGGGHHRHRGGQPPGGQIPEEGEPGQGEQQGAP